MLDEIRALLPNFSHFEDQTVQDAGVIVGYQTVLITKPGYPFAGGSGPTLNEARRICAAEAIERAWFQKIVDGPEDQSKRFAISEYKTTCGFAAGFEAQPTAFRSVCEAIERWAWSTWIDKEFKIESKPISTQHSPLAKFFASEFDEILFFELPLSLNFDRKPNFLPGEYVFRATIAKKDSGIFPGSRVTTAADQSWDHAIVEAWRHLKIFENELSKSVPTNIFDKRIKRFALEGESTLKRIERFHQKPWTSPKISVFEQVTTGGKYFVWRTLCEDFLSWDAGDENRFIY